jgi:hypothetical protein
VGTVHAGGHDVRVSSNVGSFIANLPEMLGAMVVDPRCLIAVIEFEDVRYVQYWVTPEGAIAAEVVSNRNIGDAVALSPEDEERLRRSGWSEPSSSARPNWRFEAYDVAGLMQVVTMSRDAVYNVLGERDHRAVSVRIWEGHYTTRSTEDDQESSRVHYQRTLRDLARRLEES